jgi:hypothetical protein
MIINKDGTPEILRDETVINPENIKTISEHVPKHLVPLNDEQFGNYLAGLIDGDGHFSSKQQLVIVFHSLDASLAYYLITLLAFGTFRKVKDKNAFLLIVAARKGIELVINLINGKIRLESKFDQITKNILNHTNYREFKENLNLKLYSDKCLKNHWLTGFYDADASFQIKFINRNNKTEIRLNFQIDQKKNDLLLLIKDYLGGLIAHNQLKEFTYSSDSYGSARKVIEYFNYYHLLSSKHIHFLKWRKTYIDLQKENLY